MKLESITCNHCGAPLQVPESANYVTCTHCDRQLAIHRTENSRFTEVVDDLREQVSRLTEQTDLAALDREWEIEKEQYFLTGKNGHRYIPTKSESVTSGLIASVFGIIWTAAACGIGGAGRSGFEFVGLVFPLFGVLFVIVGISYASKAFNKAERYTRAYENYQQRRRDLAG